MIFVSHHTSISSPKLTIHCSRFIEIFSSGIGVGEVRTSRERVLALASVVLGVPVVTMR